MVEMVKYNGPPKTLTLTASRPIASPVIHPKKESLDGSHTAVYWRANRDLEAGESPTKRDE